MKFIPFMETGRVFRDNEGISLWVTNDENKIPIRVQADLLVGSIKADLDNYSGIVNPLLIKQKS